VKKTKGRKTRETVPLHKIVVNTSGFRSVHGVVDADFNPDPAILAQSGSGSKQKMTFIQKSVWQKMC
jgi:hypothetical protein